MGLVLALFCTVLAVIGTVQHFQERWRSGDAEIQGLADALVGETENHLRHTTEA